MHHNSHLLLFARSASSLLAAPMGLGYAMIWPKPAPVMAVPWREIKVEPTTTELLRLSFGNLYPSHALPSKVLILAVIAWHGYWLVLTGLPKISFCVDNAGPRTNQNHGNNLHAVCVAFTSFQANVSCPRHSPSKDPSLTVAITLDNLFVGWL